MTYQARCLLAGFMLSAATMAPTRAGGASIPTTTLNNGFELPMVGLGMGPWCNSPRCPAPAKPCSDCYNDSAAAADVILAASAGIQYIDTALGYGNQVGVGDAVNRYPGGRSMVTVQTKVPPCSSTLTAAECMNKTTSDIETDFLQLNISVIDSILLHSAPSNGTKGDNCGTGSCDLAKAQWNVLLDLYDQKKVRVIGVSNWCQRCFECLKVGGVTQMPMINQIQYHAGMGSADPDGLISYCKENGVTPQAYSPLGNYASHSLIFSNVTVAMGKKYGVSSAQVALRWVVQNEVPLIVAADNRGYLLEDAAIFNFTLSDSDFNFLSTSPIAPEGPTRGNCVGIVT